VFRESNLERALTDRTRWIGCTSRSIVATMTVSGKIESDTDLKENIMEIQSVKTFQKVNENVVALRQNPLGKSSEVREWSL
jgi:hypothetical protein